MGSLLRQVTYMLAVGPLPLSFCTAGQQYPVRKAAGFLALASPSLCQRGPFPFPVLPDLRGCNPCWELGGAATCQHLNARDGEGFDCPLLKPVPQPSSSALQARLTHPAVLPSRTGLVPSLV